MYNEMSGLKMSKTVFRPAPPLNYFMMCFHCLLRLYSFIVIHPPVIEVHRERDRKLKKERKTERDE